jgi:hypothetical protein
MNVADLPIQNSNGLYNGGSTPSSYYSTPTVNGSPAGGAGGPIVIQASEYEQFLAFQEWQRQRKAQQYSSPQQQQQQPTPPSPQPQQQQAFTYASPSPAYDRLRVMDNTMDDPQATAPPTPILQLPPVRRQQMGRALPPRMPPPQKYVPQQQQYQQYQPPPTPVTVTPATPATTTPTANAATPVTTNTTTHQPSTTTSSSPNSSSNHHHHQPQACNPLGTLFVWYVYLQNHAVQVKSFVDQAYQLVSIFKKDGLSCQG